MVSSNINHTLTYTSSCLLPPGTLVLVSLRKKMALGCVFEKVNKPIIKFKIKEVSKVYFNKKFSENLIRFHKWVSYYNLCNSGSVLKLFLPNQKIVEESPEAFLYFNNKKSEKMSEDESLILKFLEDKPNSKKVVRKSFANSNSVIKSLLKKKLIYEEKKIVEPDIPKTLINLNLNRLNTYQKKAYADIIKIKNKKDNKPVFLDGVTGSGKTEIYFQLIKDVLKEKKQILVLIPEIGLSEQWLKRFKNNFGFFPLIWNSKVKLSDKRKTWNTSLKGIPIVVVGARSSLFLPFSNLGLIIVDEENDQSYKQEEGVIYNARDMAVLKSNIEKIMVLLVSATPSLETFKNCEDGKYFWIKINNRFNDSLKPEIKIINMKKSKLSFISEELKTEIKENIKKKKQSLILINRRGYAPIAMCLKCKKIRKCQNCDTNLVYHKETNFLICHQCGRKEVLNSNCKECGEKKLIFVGVGLEKVYEEVKKIFKKARVVKLSSDFVDKEKFLLILKKIEKNQVDIIVGTQIISKGFDFENLKSVFIIDFDMWFHNADIRTNEKVFQLTQQVSGRAGRRQERGRVLIQTYDPKNKLLVDVVKDRRDYFYRQELKIRNKNALPPFSRLLSITISSNFLDSAESKAIKIKDLFEKSKNLIALGPIPAQIFYLNKNYRFKLLIKASRAITIQSFITSNNIILNNDSKVKVKLDIDPHNLY